MRKLFITGAVLALAACAPAVQEIAMQDGLITKQSAHSVQVTIDRLEAAAKGKGLNVFARINHQANAAGLGLEMHGSTLLIFGSPKIGSPLMNASPTVGLDLPVKALAYEKGGNVYLSYNDPAYLKTRHNIGAGGDKALMKMGGALDGLTNHAIAE